MGIDWFTFIGDTQWDDPGGEMETVDHHDWPENEEVQWQWDQGDEDLVSSHTHDDSLAAVALTVGDPEQDLPFINMQEGMNSCGIASQKGVIEAVTGQEIPEIELSYYAYKQGWYDPANGTRVEDIGNLLGVYGIPVDRGYDRSVEDLYTALQGGEKVIVCLDSAEIWSPGRDGSGNPLELADQGHAVWVTGMHQDEDGSWYVIMNDSGLPDGAGNTVLLEDFMNAWDDFGNYAVVTRAGSA